MTAAVSQRGEKSNKKAMVRSLNMIGIKVVRNIAKKNVIIDLGKEKTTNLNNSKPIVTRDTLFIFLKFAWNAHFFGPTIANMIINITVMKIVIKNIEMKAKNIERLRNIKTTIKSIGSIRSILTITNHIQAVMKRLIHPVNISEHVNQIIRPASRKSKNMIHHRRRQRVAKKNHQSQNTSRPKMASRLIIRWELALAKH